MSSLSEKGLKISKNALFSLLVGRATKLLGTPFKVVTVLNEAADKLTDHDKPGNKFHQLFDTAKTLLRLVRHYISGDYRDIATNTIISGLAVLLYVVSPIDLIPDFIPVVGFLDDLSLVSWFIGKFNGEIVKYREWEDARNDAATPDEAPRPDDAAEPANGDAALPAAAELGHS